MTINTFRFNRCFHKLSNVLPIDVWVFPTNVMLPEVLISPAVDVLMEWACIILKEPSSFCNELSISNRDKSEPCKILLASSLLFNEGSSDLLPIHVIVLLSK